MDTIGSTMQAILDAANRHEVAAAGDYLAEGFVYENMTMPGPQGKEGFDGIHAALFAAFPDLHYRTVNQVQAGATLVTECLVTGTHRGEFFGIPASGKQISLPICFLTEHDDQGRARRWKSYYDAATLLRQLGVMQ